MNTASTTVVTAIGVLNYVLTSLNAHWRFTNGSSLLVLAGVLMFLIGLLSEQLTNLQFKDSADD